MSRAKKANRRGRHEGSVRQTKSGTWEASLSIGRGPDGKRKRLYANANTKKEALEKLAELRQKPQALRPAGSTTLTAYIDTWLNDKHRHVAESTHYRYASLAKHIKPYLGHHKVKDIAAVHVRAWYDAMTKDGFSRHTQAKAGQLLGMIFRAAVTDQEAYHNPISLVPKPRGISAECRILTPEEIQVFLAETDKCRLFGVFVMAVTTGARLGELLALTWLDVNFETATVEFRRALSETAGRIVIKEPKTARGKRVVDLPKFATDALAEQRKANVAEGLASCDLCFPSTRGTHFRETNIRRYMKPALARAGLASSIRFHDLRHSAATWLLHLGMSAQDVSRTLGHANVAFTIATYTHALQSSRSAALAKMDEQMGS